MVGKFLHQLILQEKYPFLGNVFLSLGNDQLFLCLLHCGKLIGVKLLKHLIKGLCPYTEFARVWADVGYFAECKGGKYCICAVTGPDEYNAVTDNNFYTNLMGRENIRYAYMIHILQKVFGEPF